MNVHGSWPLGRGGPRLPRGRAPPRRRASRRRAPCRGVAGRSASLGGHEPLRAPPAGVPGAAAAAAGVALGDRRVGAHDLRLPRPVGLPGLVAGRARRLRGGRVAGQGPARGLRGAGRHRRCATSPWRLWCCSRQLAGLAGVGTIPVERPHPLAGRSRCWAPLLAPGPWSAITAPTTSTSRLPGRGRPLARGQRAHGRPSTGWWPGSSSGNWFEAVYGPTELVFMDDRIEVIPRGGGRPPAAAPAGSRPGRRSWLATSRTRPVAGRQPAGGHARRRRRLDDRLPGRRLDLVAVRGCGRAGGGAGAALSRRTSRCDVSL